jgi:DNA polymerase-4
MRTKHKQTYPLKYLFLDLNSYFASVEQQEVPHLRGKPVAVVPMMTDATCAIAASYEAKAYGVKTGTKIFEAKQMCPNLICVPARPDVYVDYHARIKEAAGKILPINKVWSVDEFDCILMGREQEIENAIALAHQIKLQIRQDVGPYVRASIGLAPNSFLAKVATDMQKPDGLVVFNELPGRLFDLELIDLPGIGINMEARLRRAGVKTVEHLWNISPKHARKIWNSVQGERFWYWLHGYDIPAQDTQPSMVGHSRVLDPELRSPEKTRLMARRLLTKATYRLRRKGLHAARLSFSTRLLNGIKWHDERCFPPANDVFTFLPYLEDMWSTLSEQTLGARFKKVSVILSNLHKTEAVTGELFLTCDPAQHRIQQKREQLSRALDHLQNKYHRETVWMGVIPQTLAGHVGTKIAFSRVPDKEEFWN